jgi:hypothetical protein
MLLRVAGGGAVPLGGFYGSCRKVPLRSTTVQVAIVHSVCWNPFSSLPGSPLCKFSRTAELPLLYLQMSSSESNFNSKKLLWHLQHFPFGFQQNLAAMQLRSDTTSFILNCNSISLRLEDCSTHCAGGAPARVAY